jgi:hypothetical protein
MAPLPSCRSCQLEDAAVAMILANLPRDRDQRQRATADGGGYVWDEDINLYPVPFWRSEGTAHGVVFSASLWQRPTHKSQAAKRIKKKRTNSLL